jgi:hypothetical protein
MGTAKKSLCTLVRKHLEARELLAKQGAGLRLHGGERDARLDAADDVDPLSFRIVHVGNAEDHGHRLERQIKLGRIAGKPIAEVTLRCDADNSDRPCVDAKCASDDAGIRAVVVRPRLVAHDRGKVGALSVVRFGEEAASSGLKSKSVKVVARDKFTHHRFCEGLRAFATSCQRAILESRLHGGQLLKLRQLFLEQEVRLGRKQRVVTTFAVTGVDTAIVSIANTDESLGIPNGQIAQEDGIHQREDSGIGSDAESQGENDGDGKTRRLAQLAKCVGKILDQNPHAASPQLRASWNGTLQAVRCSI